MQITLTKQEAVAIIATQLNNQGIAIEPTNINIETQIPVNANKIVLSDYFLWQLVKANLKVAGIKLIREVESQFGGYIGLSDAKSKIEQAYNRVETDNAKF